MARTKTTFTLDLGNGSVAKRTSESMHYTHAVVAEYTEKDRARDVEAAERALRVARLDLADLEQVEADPAAVAEYARLVATFEAAHDAAKTARVAYETLQAEVIARQKALGYGVPGARNIAIGMTAEEDRALRATNRADGDWYTASDKMRQHPLHNATQVRGAIRAREADLAAARAREVGPATRHAHGWATSFENAKRHANAARRAGFTATIKQVRG